MADDDKNLIFASLTMGTPPLTREEVSKIIDFNKVKSAKEFKELIENFEELVKKFPKTIANKQLETAGKNPKAILSTEESERQADISKGRLDKISKEIASLNTVSPDVLAIRLGELIRAGQSEMNAIESLAAQGAPINTNVFMDLLRQIADQADRKQVEQALATQATGRGEDGGAVQIDHETGEAVETNEKEHSDAHKKGESGKKKHSEAKEVLNFKKKYQIYGHLDDEDLAKISKDKMTKILVGNEIDIKMMTVADMRFALAEQEVDESIKKKAMLIPEYSQCANIAEIKKAIEDKKKSDASLFDKDPKTKDLYELILTKEELQRDKKENLNNKQKANAFRERVFSIEKFKDLEIKKDAVAIGFAGKVQANPAKFAGMDTEVKAVVESTKDIKAENKVVEQKNKVYEAGKQVVDKVAETETTILEQSKKAENITDNLRDDQIAQKIDVLIDYCELEHLDLKGSPQELLPVITKLIKEDPINSKDEFVTEMLEQLTKDLSPEVKQTKVENEKSLLTPEKTLETGKDRQEQKQEDTVETALDTKKHQAETPQQAKDTVQGKEPEQQHSSIQNTSGKETLKGFAEAAKGFKESGAKDTNSEKGTAVQTGLPRVNTIDPSTKSR